MKENEKKGILILIILSIVVVAMLFIGLKLNKDNQIGNATPQNQGQALDEQKNKDKAIEHQEDNAKIGEFIKTNEQGEIVNISEKVNSTKDIDGFTLTDVSLKETNGETVLACRITNMSGKKQNGFFGNIVLMDKENKEIGKIPVKVSDMKAGETREIGASITESYAENAYDYRLEK